MRKKLTKKQWQLRKKILFFFRISILTILTLTICILGVHIANELLFHKSNVMDKYEESEFVLDGVKLGNGKAIQAELLTPNEYSRSEKKIAKMNGIVIHYVGNPGTTAQNNRDYFEGLAASHATHASSNFVVGLKGEIIQCVPANEVAYCSNERNDDTLSIEVCHPGTDGKFKKATYKSVVELTAYLCDMFDLNDKDVIRHYDVTGKKCPLYYVEHEDEWKQFREDVKEALKVLHQKENGVVKANTKTNE